MLDPFGGSGVTAIEAFLENRTGIQNDINPLANFIAKGVVGLSRGNRSEYTCALSEVKEQCQQKLLNIQDADDDSLSRLARGIALPKDVKLPSSSDVDNYHALFSKKQLLSLAVLKSAIGNLKARADKEGLLLAWSATLTKLNRTFLSAEGGAESEIKHIQIIYRL